jgi:hypothetical protein
VLDESALGEVFGIETAEVATARDVPRETTTCKSETSGGVTT